MGNGTTRWGAAVLIVAVFVGGSPGLLRAQPAAQPTAVRVYAAFGVGALRSGVAVIAQVTGECFAASLADETREDAWRCMSGNRILDPCFAGFQGDRMVTACPESPWTSRVTVLNLVKEPARTLANQADIGGGLPWALELVSGARCVFLTGATAVVAGMRVNYGCVGGAQSVVGEVNRLLPQWRVFVDGGQSVTLQLQEVAVAWY